MHYILSIMATAKLCTPYAEEILNTVNAALKTEFLLRRRNGKCVEGIN